MTPQTQKESYSLDEVMALYGAGKATIQPSIQAAQTAQTENQYGATFRATGNESGIEAGLKSAGNVPSSAINIGKGLYTAVTNPKQTATGVKNLLVGGGAKIQNMLSGAVDSTFGTKGFGRNTNEEAQKTFGAAVDLYKGRYGSLDAAQKTAIEDPLGFGADVLSVITGTAAVTRQIPALSNTISKVGSAVTKPVTSAATTVGNKVSNTARFGVSQATGFSPETISTIINQGEEFAKAKALGVDRTDLADTVLTAVKREQADLSDLGKTYDTVRQSNANVALPDNWLKDTLNKYGLKEGVGQVIADRTSKTRNITDLNKIQEFIDNWGDAKNLTAEEYLNMRHDLAELAKYDQTGKSTVVRQFAQDIREGVLNSDPVRNQVPGLKDLDAQYSVDREFLNKLEKDFIDPKTGGLKDGAASKAVNAINAANPERLARLEQLYPGFQKQAEVIKAVEDVENAMGLKVGTYTRTAIAGGGLLTGNVPVIIGAILSMPEIAVPLLRGYGMAADKVAPILRVVKDAANDINNFRTPGALQQYLENYQKENGAPLGMSIQTTEGKALRVVSFTDKQGRKVKHRIPINEVLEYTRGLDAQGIKYNITTD